ncbi:MAG: copper resistance CopC family protein [Lacisediminihabitans sp.]
MSNRTKRFLLIAFGALVAVGSVLGLSAPAQAHNYLVQSTPSAGEVLTTLPAEFSVITNGVLLNINGNGDGFALQIKDQNGLYYGDGCVTVDGPGMSTAAALGAPGKYTIVWQIISTDGHTASNEFSFTWQPASADALVGKGSKAAPTCHGAQSPNAKPGADARPAPTTANDSETLSAVLWIGGAVLAVGAAVVITLLLTSRKKPEQADTE